MLSGVWCRRALMTVAPTPAEQEGLFAVSALGSAFHGLHAKGNPFLLQFGFVHGANFRRLVLVFEQMAALMLAQVRPPGMTHLAETAPEREMASGFLAGGKMMVVPAFRRHKQASRLPINPTHFVFLS